MSVNPFMSLERQNFPEFSPMFKKKTPTSTEKSSSFRWSIDHIARLKPADIDIDPFTLAKTNGHSPADSEADKASDNFFSQKTILPSPWTAPMTSNKVTTSAFPFKRVTFSPLPPATAFIREESLVESEVRDNKTTDAGTQTLMTIPLNFDLLAFLGPGFSYSEDKSCDPSNSSLRRKLFGQPERQGSSSLSSSLSSEADEVQSAPSSPKVEPITPFRDPLKTPVSKKITRHPSNSSTPGPSNPLFSPAVLFKSARADTSTNPAHSSMVLGVPGGLFPDVSPIGGGCSEVQLCTGPGGVTRASQTPTGEVEEGGSGHDGGLLSLVDSGVKEDHHHHQMEPQFPSTHSKDVHMQSLPSLSPICGMSPMRVELHHYGNASTPADAEKVKVPLTSGKAACTSTPNTAAVKRQLVASPFASPVLKQPCTKRLDVLEEEEDTVPLCQLPRSPQPEFTTDDSDSESSMPQPISLADLQTETCDLTNITPTTCTSYFAQFALDDPTENDMTMGNGPHPLHSTAAGHMISNSTHWDPPIHSTMVESQSKAQVHTGGGPLVNGVIPQVSLPLVGGLSRIHPHPASSTSSLSNGTSRSTVADSGMAASGDFNFNMTALQNSNKVAGGGESGIAMSSYEPATKTGEKRSQGIGHGVAGEDRVTATKFAFNTDDKNGAPHHVHVAAVQERRKGFLQGDERERDFSSSQKHVHFHHSQFDSGLVFSPDQNLEPSEGAVPIYDRLRQLSHMTTTAAVNKFPSSEQLRPSHLQAHHDRTPSRHSNLASFQPGVKVPMSPATLHHIGGAPGLINNGAGGSHYPTFSSRLTSRCTGLSSGTVLPSRLKVSLTSVPSSGLRSPTYSSLVPPHNHGNIENYTNALSGDMFKVGGASKTTPTSRFSGKGVKSNLSGMTDDIIRKKESLKARLKFSSPIDSPVAISSPLRSPVSTRPFLGRPRLPLYETSLNRPSSPLKRWHKEGFSPHSHSQLSPIHHQSDQFRSPWQPPLSLSPIDNYHSRRAKLKLTST